MANLFDLLGTGVLVEKKEIVEGQNPPLVFFEQVKPFFPEEVYNLNSESLLYKFLFALLGDAGVGGVRKAFLAPRLFKALSSNNFDDLDKLFSNTFGLGRLNTEIYTADPFNNLLTQEEWEEVRRKDGSYRSRSLDYMRGIHQGTSKEAFKLLGKAATGYECDLYERWRYLDDIRSVEPIGIPDIGKTLSESEITLAPITSSLSIQDERRLYEVTQRLKSSNLLVSTYRLDSNLIEIPIQIGTASSHYFYVQRNVTGNNSLDYTSALNTGNNWIETGIEKEAPTSAFNDRSESITFPTIFSIEASSEHIGTFSVQQQTYFAHLTESDNDFQLYGGNLAISNIPINYEINSPWLFRNADKNSFTINNHYPVGYFADKNYTLPISNNLFWASQEEIPDIEEYLILDMQGDRPINFVEFEICQKPIDITVEYWNGISYVPVTLRTDVENTTKTYYRSSTEYSWQPIALYFEAVSTQKIKLKFARRLDNFPNPLDIDFAWSVDVRRVKLGHVIAQISDFIVDTGSDILGNSFRTTLKEYSPSRSFDGQENTFWQSQANPSPFAVEALYFDISPTSDPVVIDEIYLDPVTSDCLLHIYYSTDTEETDWDNKLWAPIPRHYLLTKGNIRLPSPILTKYIKLEFTKLTSAPYNSIRSQSIPPTRYRLFPTWVDEYIQQTRKTPPKPLIDTEIFSSVTNNFTSIGIIQPSTTKLTPEIPITLLQFIKDNVESSVLAEYQTWQNPDTANSNELILDRIPEFYPNDLFSRSLVETIKDKNFMTQIVIGDTGEETFIEENPLLSKQLATIASANDRTLIEEEKTFPDMWFMRKSRHGYKIVESPRESQIAYYVAIREVKFYRRNQQAIHDDTNYYETFADTNNTLINTFVASDWRYTLPASLLLSLGTNNIVQYGNESFNGVTY